MGAALLVCRLGLAVVFVTAGVTKLLDRAGTRGAVVEFGVGRRLASVVAASLPVVEIAIGVALVPRPTAPYAATAAGGLLAAFTVAIVRALAGGQAPDCHCFGQVRSRPVGRSTVARNAGLFVCAAFVAVAGSESAGVIVVIVALVALQVWFLPRLGRDVRPRAAAVADPPSIGLPVGVPAPDFELDGVDGSRSSLSSLLAEPRPLLLVFSAAGCVPCKALLPKLAGWQRQYRDRLTIAVIARGEPNRNERTAREYGLDLVLFDERGDKAAEAYRAHGTPMAVLVAPDATIASQTVGGTGAIAGLVAYAAQPALDITARLGEPAPALILDDLGGNQVPLADLYGEPIVALFWSPTCGYSRQMLPLLHAVEQHPPAGAPRVVVISGGDAGQLREQAIRSTVLLDPDGAAMRAFEAPGTPMAVLVEDGRIASDIHAGAGAILELITTARAPAANHANGVL